MAIVPTKYSCIYCGEYYHKADSLAANTPELMATMYCCREHHDLDKELIDNQIAEINKDSAVDRQSAAVDPISTDYKVVEVGGFRLKVPIKKEGA